MIDISNTPYENEAWSSNSIKNLVLIFVGRIFNAIVLEVFNEFIKRIFPHFLEPIRPSEPFYKGRTDSIVCADKGTSIPGFIESIVAKTTKRPHFGTVV